MAEGSRLFWAPPLTAVANPAPAPAPARRWERLGGAWGGGRGAVSLTDLTGATHFPPLQRCPPCPSPPRPARLGGVFWARAGGPSSLVPPPPASRASPTGTVPTWRFQPRGLRWPHLYPTQPQPRSLTGGHCFAERVPRERVPDPREGAGGPRKQRGGEGGEAKAGAGPPWIPEPKYPGLTMSRCLWLPWGAQRVKGVWSGDQAPQFRSSAVWGTLKGPSCGMETEERDREPRCLCRRPGGSTCQGMGLSARLLQGPPGAEAPRTPLSSARKPSAQRLAGP